MVDFMQYLKRMKMINFLYYTLSRAFYEYSEKKEKVPNGASLLLTLLLSINTLMLTFSLKFIIPKGALTLFPYNIMIRVIFGSIFFLWYFFCRRFYVKKGNYIWIIEKYDKKYKERIKEIRYIGFLYTFLTPLCFIILAFFISRIEA